MPLTTESDYTYRLRSNLEELLSIRINSVPQAEREDLAYVIVDGFTKRIEKDLAEALEDKTMEIDEMERELVRVERQLKRVEAIATMRKLRLCMETG